jgi:hypothetical protein
MTFPTTSFYSLLLLNDSLLASVYPLLIICNCLPYTAVFLMLFTICCLFFYPVAFFPSLFDRCCLSLTISILLFTRCCFPCSFLSSAVYLLLLIFICLSFAVHPLTFTCLSLPSAVYSLLFTCCSLPYSFLLTDFTLIAPIHIPGLSVCPCTHSPPDVSFPLFYLDTCMLCTIADVYTLYACISKEYCQVNSKSGR